MNLRYEDGSSEAVQGAMPRFLLDLITPGIQDTPAELDTIIRSDVVEVAADLPPARLHALLGAVGIEAA